MPDSNAKKSHRRRKNKPKPKKHKPKLTKEFKETEKEIVAILNSTELSIDKVEENAEELSVAFFCQNGEPSNSPIPKITCPLAEEESEKSTESPRTQTASSFIQIEDDDPIKRVQTEKLVFSENLLFFPSSTINPYILNTLKEEPKLKPDANLIRLVNRFHEEGNDHQITSGSSLKNQVTYFKDDLLYATECAWKFNPIFYVAKLGDENSPIIPSRKLITLNIKDFRFTQHPLQQEEHILSNKLENYLEDHFRRKESQTIPELKRKLNDLRKTANELLEDGTNLFELEGNLSKLKQLRNDLYKEEVTSKDLLRSILDTWLHLKKLRKRQEFHWTSLKIKIKLIESDINADNALHTKRFETDLNEIYREELEAYYRFKRLQRSDPEKYSEKPIKPSIETIKENLKKTLQNCSRAPGEPEMEIIQSNLSDPCRPLEKIKSYYMRILFDGQLVSSTRGFRLEPDLSLAANECMGIYLDRRIPKEIKIKLYEKKKLPSLPIKIANITVPLPSIDINQQHLEIISFSSHKQENICGQLRIGFSCDEGVNSEEILRMEYPSPPPKTKISKNVLEERHKKKRIDFSTEATQIDDETSDEDDEQSKENQEDTCTFQESQLQFCSREEIDTNPRLRMLSSIYKRDMRTKDIRFLSYLEGEIEEDYEEKVIDMGNWMDSIDIHKHNGKKYLKNLYEVVRNHCDQLSLISGSSDDLLVGYHGSNMTLKSFFASIGTMFSPRSSMISESISQATSLSYKNVGKFNIVINVVRATGIPVRSFSTPNLERRDSSSTSMFSSQTFKYSNVRPYVTASFMDKSSRTMTADGSSPTWNEHLILQVTGNPVELKGDIKIAIFDEYVENHINEERSMEFHQRFQSNWLGEYRLPISTILTNQRIDGVFELNSPKVFLGYNAPSLSEALPIENIPEIKERVNVWLYVSVDPSFDVPQVSMKNLECSELKDVRNHLQEWCIEAKDMQPNRFIDPLVCTIDGKRVCLTRLLEPVPLPIETSENLLIDTACRYVSLLNVLRQFDPCMMFKGIWLDNETLLDTGWGSGKDLGILLANYFLTIGIRCWVVLGIAYPHGESAYVLYKDDTDFVVVDPSTGKKYSTKDSYCPVNKVFFIFSQNNIYCNIQSENRVSMMNFDVEDSSCWFAMFSKRNPAPLGGIQKLNYTYLNSNNISELRKNIERKIMKKISTWRPMQKTIWNRAFQNSMLKILVDLEYESTFTSIPSTINHSQRLEAELGNYKVFGFTLNFSYINLSSISERIKSTGIHLNIDKKVEFSVAVHIHAYPYNILSIWIFIMSIIPT